MIRLIHTVFLAMLSSGCVFNSQPPHAINLPNEESNATINKVTGSYCFCSVKENLQPYRDTTTFVGAVPVDELDTSSLVTVESLGEPTHGLSMRVSINNSHETLSVYDDEAGGCFIDGEKVRCHQSVYHGAVLGVGWNQSTMDFSKDNDGALRITKYSGECGLAFLLLPFCESSQHSLVLRPITTENQCRCEDAD